MRPLQAWVDKAVAHCCCCCRWLLGRLEPIARMPERSTNPSGSLTEEWDSGGGGGGGRVLPGRSVQMWGTATEREGAGPAGRQASFEGTWWSACVRLARVPQSFRQVVIQRLIIIDEITASWQKPLTSGSIPPCSNYPAWVSPRPSTWGFKLVRTATTLLCSR